MAGRYSISLNASPHIVIIGAGAMGLLHAAHLVLGGCSVSIVARRSEVIEAINTHGIGLEAKGKLKHFGGARAVKHIKDAPTPDLVLLCVKGPDSSAAMAEAAPHIPKTASVLTLQNGLGNIEAIAAHVPKHQIVAGASYTGVTLLGPELVRLGGYGPTLLGELSGKVTPRLLALAQIFERSGLRGQISENIQGVIWSKVLVNAGINPIAALTRLKNGELAADPESCALMSVLVSEGASLAERLGIKLAEPDPVAHTLSVAYATGDNMASMLQDIMQGRKTEIDSINGMLVQKGCEVGLVLPLNRTVTHLVHLLEKASLKQS